MPTEKNAAFLPMQQCFKLDRQRVKSDRFSVMLIKRSLVTNFAIGRSKRTYWFLQYATSPKTVNMVLDFLHKTPGFIQLLTIWISYGTKLIFFLSVVLPVRPRPVKDECNNNMQLLLKVCGSLSDGIYGSLSVFCLQVVYYALIFPVPQPIYKEFFMPIVIQLFCLLHCRCFKGKNIFSSVRKHSLLIHLLIIN